MKLSLNGLTWTLLTALLLIVLGSFYLQPAAQLALEGNRHYLISEHGDTTTLPFFYYALEHTWKTKPSLLLYGSVYTPQLNPPQGQGLWVPWIERAGALALYPFSTPETLPTFYMWLLMVLDGLCFYAFARYEKWPRGLSLGLAIAFAFNPFTRARSVAHSSLVGIFYLPVVFLALRILQRRRDRTGVVLSGLLFLFAAMAAQYYVMILVAIAPLLLWFYFREGASRTDWRNPLGRLVIAAAPAVLFLAWNVLAPLPSALQSKNTVVKPPPNPYFLSTFCSRPIDYLSGDLLNTVKDLNPIRETINQYVWNHMGGSNTVERSNGIRWSLLLLFVLAAWLTFRPKSRERLDPKLRSILYFFFFFTLMSFWCSLSPRSIAPLGRSMGPSLWIFTLIPNFRVPSRFGPVAHFGVLVSVGSLLAYWISRQRVFERKSVQAAGTLALCGLMVLEYFPLGPILTDHTYPARTDLVRKSDGYCGAGIYFPYVGPGPGERLYYPVIQQMRNTPCQLNHINEENGANQLLLNRLGDVPVSAAFQSGQVSGLEDRLIRFLQCTHSEWIVFRATAPTQLREEICSRMQWTMTAPDACRSMGSPETAVNARQCLGVLRD